MPDQIWNAANRLGVLEGQLRLLRGEARILFARRLAVLMVKEALRIEGHAFTPDGFDCWAAGVAPLTHETARATRSARSVALVILGDLQASLYEPLAQAAADYAAVFGGVDNGEPGAEAALEELNAARELASKAMPTTDGPAETLAAIARMAANAVQSPTFATQEREFQVVKIGDRRATIEQQRRPAPRWALDLAAGEVFTHLWEGCPPLPFPNLFDQGVLMPDASSRERLQDVATAIARSVDAVLAALAGAWRDAELLEQVKATARANSSLPQLAGLILGFGPMRSTQLELLTGKSELGVRKIVESGRAAGVLVTHRVRGIRMISAWRDLGNALDLVTSSPSPAPLRISVAVDAELAAAEARVTELLARFGETVSARHLDGENEADDDVPGWV